MKESTKKAKERKPSKWLQYKRAHRTYTLTRYITYTEIVRKVADRIQHFLRIVPCGFSEYLGDLAGIAYLYLDEWQTN